MSIQSRAVELLTPAGSDVMTDSWRSRGAHPPDTPIVSANGERACSSSGGGRPLTMVTGGSGRTCSSGQKRKKSPLCTLCCMRGWVGGPKLRKHDRMQIQPCKTERTHSGQNVHVSPHMTPARSFTWCFYFWCQHSEIKVNIVLRTRLNSKHTQNQS